MAEVFYPPVSFIFSVSIDGISGTNEGNFQEVSGLQVKLGTEEVKEGGENRYILRLPTPPKYENLVLKRGMLDISSPLITWARQGVESFTFEPKTVLINLLDDDGSPLASWNVANAYPVSLLVSEFKAQESQIVIETLELAFNNFTRIN
jgi:phage tail-like protein